LLILWCHFDFLFRSWRLHQSFLFCRCKTRSSYRYCCPLLRHITLLYI